MLIDPKITGKACEQSRRAAQAGNELDAGRFRHVRVIEYEIPDRDGGGNGELIVRTTTITHPREHRLRSWRGAVRSAGCDTKSPWSERSSRKEEGVPQRARAARQASGADGRKAAGNRT